MRNTRAFAQINRVASEGSKTADMWILETSEKEASGYSPKRRLVYNGTHKRVTIRMAQGSINDYNVMVGSGPVPEEDVPEEDVPEEDSGLVRIDSVTTPGGSGKMTITFDRDEAEQDFALYVYVLDAGGEYEPVYFLAAGDPKPPPTVRKDTMAVTYGPPPVIIGGGTPFIPGKP